MSFIAGIGKINIDLIYSGLTRLPEEGEELYSEGFKICLGGGAPATIINLSRLNIPVSLATYIGKDLFSDFAVAEMNKTKIKITNLYQGGNMAVNISTAILTPNDRSFVSYGEQLVINDTVLNDFYNMARGAKFVIMEKGLNEVYRKLKSEGTKLILDVSWDPDMSLKTYREYLELADYFLPNRREAIKITNAASYKEAAVILSDYFPEVIIKLDSEGTYLYRNGEGKIIESNKEFIHKDSTGAGDAFLSGFLYGLYNGYQIEKCIAAGNLTGGKCVSDYGCLTAYLSEKELIEMLNN